MRPKWPNRPYFCSISYVEVRLSGFQVGISIWHANLPQSRFAALMPTKTRKPRPSIRTAAYAYSHRR
jgi:hypothetical protein